MTTFRMVTIKLCEVILIHKFNQCQHWNSIPQKITYTALMYVLINITFFFRSHKSFKQLKNQSFVYLVWNPLNGCSKKFSAWYPIK